MAQFALPNYPNGPFYQCMAVSQSSDPTGSWYRYVWQVPVDKMNDYPKYGIWPDGYYMTVNQFAGGTGTVRGRRRGGVRARQDDWPALPAQAIYFDLYSVDPNLWSMLPTDLDGSTLPPAGSPNYIVQFDDDAWGYPADQLELYKFHVDWTTPANSTFTGPTIINLTTLGLGFDANLCGFSRDCIAQPGTTQKLDAISDRLMYRLAYRNFGDHESLVFNHTVDAEWRRPRGDSVVRDARTERDAEHLPGRHLCARRRPAVDGQPLDGCCRQHRARVTRCRAGRRIRRSDMSAGSPGMRSARCRKAKPP